MARRRDPAGDHYPPRITGYDLDALIARYERMDVTVDDRTIHDTLNALRELQDIRRNNSRFCPPPLDSQDKWRPPPPEPNIGPYGFKYFPDKRLAGLPE